MPPRPPACCKAVQRQLLTPSDSIWVSDEALSASFRRFCSISRTSRRYGSSLPGPMESRRRLGKRRMTQVSDAIPSPAHNSGSIWGAFWDTDRTQWQWQAPTSRPSGQDKSAAALPSWLLEWDATSQEIAQPTDVEVAEREAFKLPATVENDIRRFRESLQKTTGKNKITTLCWQFSAQFKTNLKLGLVSMESLENALHQLSVDIVKAYPNEKLTSYLSLAFYGAVWEGIEASKVLGPADINARILDQLISLVASLPVTQGTQALAHRILHSVSDSQLRSMKEGLKSLVQRWSESWLTAPEPGNCAKEMISAYALVAEAVERGVNAQSLAMALEHGPNFEQELNKAQKAVSDAHVAVLKAIEATVKIEDIISPLRVSAKALALALGKLPNDLVVSLIASCTKHIVIMCKTLKPSLPIRHRWLCVVAQMPNLSENQLVQTWKTLDPSNGLKGNQCAEVVLNHWISQNKVEKSTAVMNTFTASSPWHFSGRSSSFAKLLLALDKHRQMCFTRTGDLFSLFRDLGRYREISNILVSMKELDMKIPTTILAKAVEEMSAHDTRRALDLFYLPYEMKLGYPIRPDFIPNFVLALINDPKIPPGAIWNVLNIPIYHQGRARRKFQPPHLAKPLPSEMIDLMHKMAIAFARSEARPPRVAFRNVCQCLYHLRLHNAPTSSKLARAVTHAGATRSIMNGMIVGKERLRYMLHLVARIEGEVVAKEMDETVYKWRQFVKTERIKLQRRANPLRVGVIG